MYVPINKVPAYDAQKRYQASQTASREQLIVDNIPLVKRIAERMAIRLPPHMQLDDLIGYGAMGLMDAARRYDARQGVAFEAFATKRIKGAIIDGIRSEDWLSDSMRRRVKAVERTYAFLEGKLGRPATDQEVADELSITLPDLHDILAKAASTAMLSLDSVFTDSEGSGGLIAETVSDTSEDGPQDELVRKEVMSWLAEALKALPEREQLVLSLYYFEELTVVEIAEILGISKGRVSQLHTKALMRLRGALEAKKDLILQELGR